MNKPGRVEQKYQSYVGKQISNLHILGFVRNPHKPDYVYFEYRCSCGKTGIALIHNVIRKLTKSCGCLQILHADEFAKKSITHGRSWTPEWTAWCRMRTRCSNPHDKRYKRYGERGIKVCERWLHSFENFFADIGLRPSPAHSLGRIHNDRGYEPSNCEWQTVQEQANNMSTNHHITFDDKTMNLVQWARYLGIHRTTIERRLKKGQPFKEIYDRFIKPRS